MGDTTVTISKEKIYSKIREGLRKKKQKKSKKGKTIGKKIPVGNNTVPIMSRT
jgi:hypothetical protein